MESFLYVIEILAVLVFAHSGVVAARRSGFDYVGVLTVAVVSAFGGGTLRDVLLNRFPLYWIENWEFLLWIFGFTIVEIVLLRLNEDLSNRKMMRLIDALGLGLFCASGVGIALERDVPLVPAALIGVITGTFGGLLRDILCNRTPRIFDAEEPIYATCAFAGAWSYILLHWLGFPPVFALTVCIAVTFLLRVAAIVFDVRLALRRGQPNTTESIETEPPSTPSTGNET